MIISGGLVEAFCGLLRVVREAIQSGSPATINAYAGQLQGRADEFTKLLGQLRTGRDDVAKVWRQGTGREATLSKFDQLLEHFTAIIKVLEQVVPLLRDAAGNVQKSQTLFDKAIRVTDPQIRSILSQSRPDSVMAAKALALATTSQLQGVISAIGKVLEALGVKGIGQLMDAVAQVAGQVQQLSSRTPPASPPPAQDFTQYSWRDRTDNTWIKIDVPDPSLRRKQ